MSESYWTKRRKLRSNVQTLLANIAENNGVPVNQTVDQCTPTVLACNIANSSDLIAGNNAGSTCCEGDSDDCTSDWFVSDDHEIRSGCDVVSSESDTEDEGDDSYDIRSMLASWATKYSITLLSLSALLEILKPILPCLPKDPRTLLGSYTKSCSVDVTTVSGGSYHYFGILNNVLPLLEQSSEVVHQYISLHLNIDGVPLFKSTSGQFWPVLGRVYTPFVSEPFVIALFFGNEKPKNLDFLTDFVEEYNTLRNEGIHVFGKTVSVRLSAIICDAPARAFVKNIKSHSGYSACERCTQRGEWNGKMTFPETNAKLRTDEDFINISDEEHHLGPSPLSSTGVGMVTHFVLDYMHLVCLGVMKRLILTWMHGPLSFRLGNACIKSMSDYLVSLREHMPVEFCRKPRSLLEVKRWKATEFRQFLLYTGPVVLLGKVSDVMYKNFLLLSVAMYILLSNNLCMKYSEYAGDLLKLFVEHYSEVYGRNMVVYNVHNLLHLADDAKRYGSLDNVSSFPFESFLGCLIKLVRKPNRPLQQVVRRIHERKLNLVASCVVDASTPSVKLERLYHTGVVPTNCAPCNQYKQVFIQGAMINLESGNNCIVIGEDVVLVCNIISMAEEVLFVCQKFRHVENFFDYPLESKLLGVLCVHEICEEKCVISAKLFKCKCVLLPEGSKYVALPLVHKV